MNKNFSEVLKVRKKRENIHINLIKTGVRRRKRDGIFMRTMTVIVVFFLTATLLFMDNANEFQMQTNYDYYGEWLLRTPVSDKIDSPYLEKSGEIWTGGAIYCLTDKEKNLSKNDTNTVKFVNPVSSLLMAGKNIGSMDNEMIKNGHIRLKEGRFPKKDNEIVLEESALKAIDNKCGMGDYISFYVASDDDTVSLALKHRKLRLNRVRYRIVGIIREYASLWNGGEKLPNAFVTKSAFVSLNMTKSGYAFRSIRKKYAGADICDFAANLIESVQKRITDRLSDGSDFDECGYAVNDYAYGNSFFGSKSMYRNMTYILMVLGSAVMAYVMTVYYSKRKKFYLRLLEIGADRKKVFKISLCESLYYVLPVAVVSLFISYFTAMSVVYTVAKRNGIKYFFIFNGKTLFMIAASFIAVFVISYIFSWIMLGSRRITWEKKNLSAYACRRLKKRAERSRKLNVCEYEKRQRICSLLSVLFMRITGIGVCICIFICSVQINSKVKLFKSVCIENRDFVVQTKVRNFEIKEAKVPAKKHMDEGEGKVTNYIYAGEGTQKIYMKDVFLSEFTEFLSEIKGVKKAEYSLWDDSHIFSWNKKGTADYYKNHLSEGAEYIDTSTAAGKEYAYEYDSLMYRGIYYKNAKDIWNIISDKTDKKSTDYDEFNNGNEIILFEQKYNQTESGDKKGFDETIKKGDVLNIQTKGKDIKVRVSDILAIEDFDFMGLGDTKPYMIAGSNKLAEKIAAQDGIKAGYNNVKIDFSRVSDTAAVDKILERKCENLNYESESNYKKIDKAFKVMVRETLTYRTLAVIITVIYIFILVCILYEEYERKKAKRKLLKNLGVQPKEFTKSVLKNGLREASYLFISLPISYVIYGIGFILEWQREYGEQYSQKTGSFSYADAEYIRSYLFNRKIFELNERNFVFYKLADLVDIYKTGAFFALMFSVVVISHYVLGKEKRYVAKSFRSEKYFKNL